jgi:hypothetical protein
MAKSTLLNRFEALTGGEEGGGGCLGVSKAFTLGTGTFPRGIFGLGVCTAGAGVTGTMGVGPSPTGGVLGSVTSEDACALISDSQSRLMMVAPRGIGLGGFPVAGSVDGRVFSVPTCLDFTGLCIVFCRFASLSTAHSFSCSPCVVCSCALRASFSCSFRAS